MSREAARMKYEVVNVKSYRTGQNEFAHQLWEFIFNSFRMSTSCRT